MGVHAETPRRNYPNLVLWGEPGNLKDHGAPAQPIGIFLPPPLITLPTNKTMSMKTLKESQDARIAFYKSKEVARYIRMHQLPKSKHAFKEMVASASSEDLESEKGRELIACLGDVTFTTHPQQVNIMDKSNGKIIVTIAR